MSVINIFALHIFSLLQVNELSSQLERQQQEVLSLTQSLTGVKQEKDTLEQELGELVRIVA